MLFKQHDKYSPVNSTHCAMLYPQNGDRVVAIDSVTLLHPVYRQEKHNKNMGLQAWWRLLITKLRKVCC